MRTREVTLVGTSSILHSELQTAAKSFTQNSTISCSDRVSTIQYTYIQCIYIYIYQGNTRVQRRRASVDSETS